MENSKMDTGKRLIRYVGASCVLFFIHTQALALTLTSTAFDLTKPIPREFTCDNKDQSPPLTWDQAPPETKSFALIVEDPDAPNGNWTHWILYNIPPATRALVQNVQTLPPGTQQGQNSWQRAQYNGPCPPTGEHRYVFTLYALKTLLNLQQPVTKEQLEKAMQGNVLEKAELIGRYKH